MTTGTTGYVDTTPPQVTRVAGGWVLAFGIGLFFVTFKEFGSVHPPTGAITATVLLGVGALLLTVGSLWYSKADRLDRRFFSENAGTEILASRRRLHVRLETSRRWLFVILLVWASCWTVFAVVGVSCVDGVCEGFVPHQEGLMEVFSWLVGVFGLVTLIVATLTRVHGKEIDRWEDLASDYLRRKDGPVPGLKQSRWE